MLTNFVTFFTENCQPAIYPAKVAGYKYLILLEWTFGMYLAIVIGMNFIGKNTTDSDKELFFGPIDPNNPEDTFHIIEDHWIMAHILHASGNFPSVSQARKNGWNKPIPEGFSFVTVGKRQRKKTIFIFIEKSS